MTTCNHPRPKLQLPGRTPQRLPFTAPTFIPTSSPAEMARVLLEAFRGINAALQQIGQRRTVVPLVENIEAREGQIITGVADGQVIKLPEPVANGEIGQVTVLLSDVVSPATVVHPDGSTTLLDQPGIYEVALAPDDTAWQTAPGIGSGGAASGAQYLVSAAHGSLPNARVAADSTEIDADLTAPTLISWVLRTASVVFGKLQNLTGLSVLGRAANSSGVMAAITSTAARQVLQSNDAGTALQWGFPVELRTAAGADQGDVFSLRFNSGNRTTANATQAAGSAAISYDWNGFITQVNDVDTNAGTNTLDFDSTTSIIPVAIAPVGTEANISFERAAITGAVALAQNANTSVFAGIRSNGVATNDRTNLNFLSGTALTAAVTDDAANDELEVRFDWNGLAARRNSGSFLTGRRALNFIEGSNISLTLNSDAVDDENELTIAVTGITSSGAVSGAIAHAAGGGASVFSGIRDDGASTTDRTNLNFVSSTTTNAVLNDDAGNDEIEVAFPVNTTAAFNWTGAHNWSAASTVQFAGPVFGIGIFSTTLAATTSNLAIGAVNCVRLTLTGSQTLTGMVPTADGQWVFIENVDTTDGLTLANDATSTAANRFFCPVAQDFFVPAQSGVWARYDGTLQRWILAYTKGFGGFNIRNGATLHTGNSTFEVIGGNGVTVGSAASGTAPFIETDLTWAVDQAASFTWTGTHLWAEKASSPTVGAGNGLFWVEDRTPNRAVFTDDVEADWVLGYAAVSVITANVAATNATTNLSCGTFTIPANTLRAASAYRLTGAFTFLHTAAFTPTLTAEVLIAGGVVETVVCDVTNVAQTFRGQVTAYIVCRTTGVGGSVMVDLGFEHNGSTSIGNALNGSNGTATDAIDTTVSRSIELRIRMTTAVASNTLTVVRGIIERLN